MNDTDLLALIAFVNNQATELAFRTARAQALNEQPTYGNYNEHFVTALRDELIRRGVV